MLKTAFIARFLDINRDEAEREWEISLMKETAKNSISPAIIFLSRNPEFDCHGLHRREEFQSYFFRRSLTEKISEKLKILAFINYAKRC